jgi:signal transduction histidine kinase
MDLRILITGGIIIFSALVIFIILFIFLYQKRYYHHLQEKEQLKSEYQKELMQAQLEIQEQTLKNIAQEIHDNIGQELSLVKLNLNTMDIYKQAELQDKITNSKNLVGKAIQDLRDLSKGMNTDSILAMGLYKAIAHELEMIKKTEVYRTRLELKGENPKLDEQKELILFRIVQESLHNIIKHANAKNIDVKLNHTDEKLELSIADDGSGFETGIAESSAADAGMGLRNMQNRAKLINADFNIRSIKNSGTTVSLSLTLNNK